MRIAGAGVGDLKLVLATSNSGKQREFDALLAPLGVTVVLQSELGVDSLAETGTSFEANALLKAKHAARITGLSALADDSGLEVDALGGRPGVWSARFAGESATDEQNNALLLQELAGVTQDKRAARYCCVLALVFDTGKRAPLIATGNWKGRIAMAPSGRGGFGYDPLFIPEGQRVSAAELPAQMKNALSHRGKALVSLVKQLRIAAQKP